VSTDSSTKNYYSSGLFITVFILFALIFIVSIFFADAVVSGGSQLIDSLGPQFLIFVLGGFIAQMIDGSLGMAYGVSASTFLLSFGVSPAAASASIHAAEVFTSGVSGLSHLKFGNVNKKLFKRLVIPGALGAVAGAYILSSFEQYNVFLRPVVAFYTLVLGVIIIRKALTKAREKTKTTNVGALAGFGGFMDSVGGGGWGPIVASTLIAKGRSPRYTIGSVNLAEFFVSFASSLTFFATIGLNYFGIIAGLILGGVAAAPIAASLTQRLPLKTMMIFVGLVICLASIRLIVISFV